MSITRVFPLLLFLFFFLSFFLYVFVNGFIFVSFVTFFSLFLHHFFFHLLYMDSWWFFLRFHFSFFSFLFFHLFRIIIVLLCIVIMLCSRVSCNSTVYRSLLKVQVFRENGLRDFWGTYKRWSSSPFLMYVDLLTVVLHVVLMRGTYILPLKYHNWCTSLIWKNP